MASREGISAALKVLIGEVAALRDDLYRTRRDLIALAGLISSKGISIDPEEWKAAAKTIAVASDPRVKKGEELMHRLLAGEKVSDEERDRWLRRGEGAHDRRDRRPHGRRRS